MLILSGFLLVLVTWSAVTLGIVALGRWIVLLIDRDRPEWLVLRASLWWGLGVATLMILVAGMAAPLSSGWLAAGFVACVILALLIGLAIRRPRVPRLRLVTRSRRLLVGSFGLAVAYLAVKALGPATNYDTGLYHLGAVSYASDFSTIPGLANLFFPFGYANAQFPLAAALGNGPWDGSGFRLLNGLLVLLLTIDAVIRLGTRRSSWGTYVLVIGLAATLIPMVAMADAMVTSPTSDTAVLLLTIVAAAYLADLLQARGAGVLEASVVLMATTLTAAMRPTMLVYAAGVALVLALLLVRRRRMRDRGWLPWIPSLAAIVAYLVVLSVRDRYLSGWLLYPLSIHPFDVPWRAADPTVWRDATLAAARDPSAPDQYVVAHSWAWITPWVSRLPRQWEPWYLLVGVTVALVASLVARRTAGFPRHPRRLLASLVPGMLAVIAWFTVSPPSFRFIWGPLFTLIFLVVGAALSELDSARRRRGAPPSGHQLASIALVACAGAVLAVTVFSGMARNQLDQATQERTWNLLGLSVPFVVAPLPTPAVVGVPLRSGLVVTTPEVGDQCWANYPLCTFNVDKDLAQRGSSIQDGFLRK